MDAVITYVDGNDPFWQAEYARAFDQPALQKRFRDWGTLPYLLRGIERFMPFVDNVFLVVSSESQVPSWASDALRIVLHRDIIPAQLLPTFNSATIEDFLHRIPGLGERYLYFNDDMFPVGPCREEDFFRDGKASIAFRRCLSRHGIYRHHCFNSDRLARRLAGKCAGPVFRRPQHTCSPMLRSACEEVFALAGEELTRRATPLRGNVNVNQYVFLDYMLFTGRAVSRAIPNKHVSLAHTSVTALRDCILTPDRPLVCINDVHLSEAQYAAYREAMLSSFQARFPVPSRFEK